MTLNQFQFDGDVVEDFATVEISLDKILDMRKGWAFLPRRRLEFYSLEAFWKKIVKV